QPDLYQGLRSRLKCLPRGRSLVHSAPKTGNGRSHLLVRVMMLVGVIVPVMVMAGVGWPLAAVGAALWLERADHRMHMGAKANHHRLKNVIRLNVDRVGRDFRRCVAIAEMPGDPGERVCVGGVNLHERLGGSNDANERTILELQGVAVG